MSFSKPRLLTGDTPTGRLHLGHWVGSVKTRVALQTLYDCYFVIANLHAFTTRIDHPEEVHHHVLNMALDYLSVGIDPEKSTIFIQSEVPAIAELTYWFSMMVPFSRLMRNPTVKEEIRLKGLQDGHYSFGFLLYPIGQVADILAFRPERVPVGEDQLPHIEMTREVARRFNQLYCGINSETPDIEVVVQGGLFPIIQAEPIKAQRLVGIGPPNAMGHLPKMSKSLGNAIYLSDTPDIIRKKVMSMYTDPNRIHTTDPGKVENNPLWGLHDAFNPDTAWVLEAQEKYRQGAIGDVECKKKLVEILVNFTDPIRKARKCYEDDLGEVLKIVKEGTLRANAQADATLTAVKTALKQNYF